jgi:hypothetical protein
MSIAVVEKAGDVRVYGSGSPGGKGAGLIKINELSLPKVSKLRTRILKIVEWNVVGDRGLEPLTSPVCRKRQTYFGHNLGTKEGLCIVVDRPLLR